MPRAIALGLISVFASGCLFIVTKDRRQEVRRTERWNDPLAIGRPEAKIVAHGRAGGVDIQVTWKQSCDFTGDLLIDYRTSTGATVELWGDCSGNDCGYVYIFTILAAPATMLFTGLITAIAVASEDDRTETKAQPLPTRRGPCDRPGANLHLVVTPPGRDAIAVTTDAQGRARVELGDDTAALQSSVQLSR